MAGPAGMRLLLHGETWVPGWVDPLYRVVQMTRLESRLSCQYCPLFERLFALANEAMEAKTPGHDVFRTLLNDLTYNLPSASRVGLSERPRTFQVAAKEHLTTSFVSSCSRAFR